MKVNENGAAGPVSPTGPASKADIHDATSQPDSIRRRVPTVKAEVIPASPGTKADRRRLAVVVVRCCVFCGGEHLHRGEAAGVRKSGCTGLRYELVPVEDAA